MTQQRRLGRGLEALLGRPLQNPGGADTGADIISAEPRAVGIPTLSIYEIDSNPFQPRQEFNEEEISSLAESIRRHGMLQPIVVRRAGQRYQLIAGERRLRAAIKAGLDEVPAQIKEADDRQMAEWAIVENLHRADLNPLEKAASFQRYLGQFQCTQEELAGRLSINRSTVANLIRLLELPEAVRQAVRDRKLSQGHARALLPLGEEQEQIAFAKRICGEGLSVRATEALVQETIRHADAEPLDAAGGHSVDRAHRTRDENLASLENEFRRALGTQVDVKQGRGGRGRIVIHFNNHDEFERLQAQLCETPGAKKSQAG